MTEPLPLGRWTLAETSIETIAGPKKKHPLDCLIKVNGRAVSFEDFFEARDRGLWPLEVLSAVREMLHRNEDVVYPPPKLGRRMLERAEDIYETHGLSHCRAYLAKTKRGGGGNLFYDVELPCDRCSTLSIAVGSGRSVGLGDGNFCRPCWWNANLGRA